MRRSFRLLVFLLVPKQSDKTFDLNLPPKTQHLGALPSIEYAGWMDLGVAGAEHVAGTAPPRDVSAAAQKAARRRLASVC
jgi:predicted NUDIX family NTP pyrophosphohydrolase